METLPSYQEATARLDWLLLVAPYVHFRDYLALCRVSHRFWAVFAPRLWHDLLVAVRKAGLDPGDDISWWFGFVFTKLSRVRPSTRSLVRVLDARSFAKDSCSYSFQHDDKTLQQSFSHALELLPCVDSILLDGHEELDANFLVGPARSSLDHWPLILSTAHTATQLPKVFFESSSIQRVIYLDISALPGSVAPLARPGLLEHLRVLKVARRELDNASVVALARHFRLRVWSLDLSYNSITDEAIDVLAAKCFSVISLRSGAHFEVEGKVTFTSHGTELHGPFTVIDESERSASFDHPARYWTDAPTYAAEAGFVPQEYQAFRSDGAAPIRVDSASSAVRAVSGDPSHDTAEAFKTSHGLTHLRVSHNRVSAFGIAKLLRTCKGRLELLACDGLPLIPPSKLSETAWPRTACLFGILGATHLFRPVYSSNLRTLRIHHSFVSNIPTLQLDGLSSIARVYLSETAILVRADEAFPERFIPDMNPRLTSLTLTGIPRRSSGPLVARLIQFLKLLSIQERDIQLASSMVSSWRSPNLLQGLRHVRLEFDPDAMEDGYSASEDLDAEELIYSQEQSFSFFDEGFTKAAAASRLSKNSDVSTAAHSKPVADEYVPTESDRGAGEFVHHEEEWNGEAFSMLVWAGSPSSNSRTVIGAYRKLVMHHNLRDAVGPATPCQVMAGAPRGSYIFQTAWCAAIMPAQLKTPPMAELSQMRDVLEQLKQFRLTGRTAYEVVQKNAGSQRVALGAPHYFWTGHLEVSTEDTMPHTKSTQYWR